MPQQQLLRAAARLHFDVRLPFVQLLGDEHLLHLLQIVGLLLLFGIIDEDIEPADHLVGEHLVDQADVLVVGTDLQRRVEAALPLDPLKQGVADGVRGGPVGQLHAETGPGRRIQDVPQQFRFHERGPALVDDMRALDEVEVLRFLTEHLRHVVFP